MKVVTETPCKCCGENAPVLIRDGKKYRVKCTHCEYITAARQNRRNAIIEWERDNQQNFVII